MRQLRKFVAMVLLAGVLVHADPSDAAAVRTGDRVMASGNYVYKLKSNGDLHALSFCCDPWTGSWSDYGRIGVGWDAFVHVAVTDGNVLYAVEPGGDLRWYKWYWTNGQRVWDSRSGAVIGHGWASFQDVVGAERGLMYGIDAAGNLRWYRPPAAPGQPFANGSGRILGTGWGNFVHVAAEGPRLYAVDRDHNLRVYERNASDSGWRLAGSVVAEDFRVAELEIGGGFGGWLYATMPNGDLRWYGWRDAAWENRRIGVGFL